MTRDPREDFWESPTTNTSSLTIPSERRMVVILDSLFNYGVTESEWVASVSCRCEKLTFAPETSRTSSQDG